MLCSKCKTSLSVEQEKITAKKECCKDKPCCHKEECQVTVHDVLEIANDIIEEVGRLEEVCDKQDKIIDECNKEYIRRRAEARTRENKIIDLESKVNTFKIRATVLIILALAAVSVPYFISL